MILYIYKMSIGILFKLIFIFYLSGGFAEIRFRVHMRKHCIVAVFAIQDKIIK